MLRINILHTHETIATQSQECAIFKPHISKLGFTDVALLVLNTNSPSYKIKLKIILKKRNEFVCEEWYEQKIVVI